MIDLENELLSLELINLIEADTPRYTVAIPHSSFFIPKSLIAKINYSQDILDDIDIGTNLIYLLDKKRANIVKFELHRYILDVNRDKSKMFPVNKFTGNPIRKVEYTDKEIELLAGLYYEYYRTLELSMRNIRDNYGTAFLLNGHSMTQLPPNTSYENLTRPSFCIGIGNDFYQKTFINKFHEALFYLSTEIRDSSEVLNKDILVNNPFAGLHGITPAFNSSEKGYVSVLLEINQGLYLDNEANLINDKVRELNEIIRLSIEESLPYLS